MANVRRRERGWLVQPIGDKHILNLMREIETEIERETDRRYSCRYDLGPDLSQTLREALKSVSIIILESWESISF